MASLFESLNQPLSTPIHDALVSGVDVLGQHEQVTFIPYVRTVLPLDGFVFWMNASILTPQQLAAHQNVISPAPVVVDGSLHYAIQGVQVEDETITVRSVDFTALEEIQAFGALDQDVMYVGTWQTSLGPFRFTFSRRNAYYKQADLHHYVGDAIYPAFDAQLIDDVSDFDTTSPVVSNSLPLWLTAIQAIPFPLMVTSALPIYPSFMVPDNLLPAYGVIHISEETTEALQAFATRGPDNTRAQLVKEHVRLTTYGLRNNDASTLLDYITDYSASTPDSFGILNTPCIRDAHRTQVELATLAQKKFIDFEIAYYQSSARDIAQQFIANSVLTITVSDITIPPKNSILFPFVTIPLQANVG